MGLPPISFHGLRHTCATLLLAKGVHPKIVSEMLGHANIGITLDTYSHVIPSMDDATAGAMDVALGVNEGRGGHRGGGKLGGLVACGLGREAIGEKG